MMTRAIPREGRWAGKPKASSFPATLSPLLYLTIWRRRATPLRHAPAPRQSGGAPPGRATVSTAGVTGARGRRARRCRPFFGKGFCFVVSVRRQGWLRRLQDGDCLNGLREPVGPTLPCFTVRASKPRGWVHTWKGLPTFRGPVFGSVLICRLHPDQLAVVPGLRKVYPYYFTFTTFTKGRWVGEKILDVFAREFRAHPAEEYVSWLEAEQCLVPYLPAVPRKDSRRGAK